MLAEHLPQIPPHGPPTHYTDPAPSQKGSQMTACDISTVFASLSKINEPLPSRSIPVKRALLPSDREKLTKSFHDLLRTIKAEIPTIKEQGSSLIPSIDFADIASAPASFTEAHRKTGVAIIRNVVPESTALKWLEDAKSYIKANPQTIGFPKDDPAVYELYFSQPQVEARSHPNVLAVSRWLLSQWHAKTNALISLNHPITYADRIRIRPPGDAGFSLGPHVDGGGVERWEREGYGGVDGVYADIFNGEWGKYDPFDASKRVDVISNLYGTSSGCTVFRPYQGWLSLSTTGPGEGTLRVNPLFSRATAYFLLRPFFTPHNSDPSSLSFLEPENWILENDISSSIQGATVGNAQELSTALHPHLDLDNTMVSMPVVHPGDYVAWHCDSIHAVDAVHQGSDFSSVMYIPTAPLTLTNARYLKGQADAFKTGDLPPDFIGGEGKRNHVGRPTPEIFKPGAAGEAGAVAMGFKPFEVSKDATTAEQKLIVEANKIMGF